MRILIAGIIGAVVSAAVWLGAEYTLQKDVGWLSILVGLGTGYAVHRAAGKDAGVGYGRGALSVILALAAIVLGRMAYAEVMQASSKAAEAAKIDVAAIKEAAEDVETDEAVEVEAPPVLSEAPPRRPGNAGPQKLTIKKGVSNIDFLWMALAALSAYVVGKGSDPIPAGEEPAPPQDEQGSEGGEGSEG